MKTRARAIVVLLSLGAWSSADGSAMGQDSAASEALFNKGVGDMEAGNYQSACPALAESNRLDPRAGTLFALAECEAKIGTPARLDRSAFRFGMHCLSNLSRNRRQVKGGQVTNV